MIHKPAPRDHQVQATNGNISSKPIQGQAMDMSAVNAQLTEVFKNMNGLNEKVNGVVQENISTRSDMSMIDHQYLQTTDDNAFLRNCIVHLCEEINTLKYRVTELETHNLKTNLIALNVSESREEDAVRTAERLCDQVGAPDEASYVTFARRIGQKRKDKDRPMQICFSRADAAWLTWQAFKSYRKGRHTDLKIFPQTHNQLREERKRMEKLADMYDSNTDKVEVKQDHVLVNGVQKTEIVQKPTLESLIYQNEKEKAETEKVQFVESKVKTTKGSIFKCYTSKITCKKDAVLAYKAICRTHQAMAASMS